VTPGRTLSSAESLFPAADDHEFPSARDPAANRRRMPVPHSRVRHLYSNVRIVGTADDYLDVHSNFVTFRTKRGFTATYMGWHRWRLRRAADEFLIELKATILDLDGLVPQGKVSLLL
jgi:p-cumate 2,3-dioxygenase beta subunit